MPDHAAQLGNPRTACDARRAPLTRVRETDPMEYVNAALDLIGQATAALSRAHVALSGTKREKEAEDLFLEAQAAVQALGCRVDAIRRGAEEEGANDGE